MTVFVVGYKGTDTDDIIGVFTDLKTAKAAMYDDFINTEFGYTPDHMEVDTNHIYTSTFGGWFDEWYIVETELK